VKNLYKSLFTFTIILSFITIIAGCSVGIRPAYYDLPPQDNSYNYGEPAYNQNYNVTPPTSDYRYDYSSTYDPWTMGNYYENYNPPQRTSRDTQTSNDSSNSPWVGDKRPVMQDRGNVTSSESKAPKDSTNLRRERIVQRENTSKEAEPSTSSTVENKKMRNVRRDIPQGNQEQPSSQKNIKKENPEPSKSDNNKKDEEDKDKNKKKTTVN